MNNFKKWLTKNGYKFESANMTGDYEGVFVDLNIIENNYIVGRINEGSLLKYIQKSGLKSEYRGHYTSLLVTSIELGIKVL